MFGIIINLKGCKFMPKEEIPRGQLSNIILSTLIDNDKYGYEIIDVVKDKTDGKVIIKQPTLYSSLRRMEEQGLISSYWRDSEIGGRRHYYSITDYGKKYAEKWQTDLNEFLISLKEKNFIPETKQKNTSTILQQDNLINLVNKQHENEQEVINEPKNKAFVQYDLFTSPTLISDPSNEIFDSIKKLREEADDEYKESRDVDHKIEKLSNLRNDAQEEIKTTYVAKNYNVNESNNIRQAFFDKTKNNKSFATAVRQNDVQYKDSKFEQAYKENENTNRIEDDYANNKNGDELNKQAFKSDSEQLEDTLYKDTHFFENDNEEEISFVDLDPKEDISYPSQSPSISEDQHDKVTNDNQPSSLEEEKIDRQINNKDDAIYITTSPQDANIPKVKRITTDRFEKFTRNYTSFLDSKLKAQEQTNIETFDDELTDNDEVELRQLKEADYSQPQIKNLEDLRQYYENSNIKFGVYDANSKVNKQSYIKINWLNFLSFSIITFISIVISITCYCILKNAQPSWNFLYLVVPLIFVFIDFYLFYKYYRAKNAITSIGNILNYNWIYQIVLSIVSILVFCSINILAGLTLDTIYNYMTTLLYPSIIILLYPMLSLINYIVIMIAKKK